MTGLSRTRIIFYLAGIFLLGGVSGMLLGWNVAPAPARNSNPPPSMERMSEHFRARLQSKLGLSDVQLQQIDPVLKRVSDEMRAVHRRSLEEMEQVMRRYNEDLGKLLSPEQKEKLEEMDRERREYLEKRFKNRGPGDRRRLPATNEPAVALPGC